MKRLISVFCIVLFSLNSQAQSPVDDAVLVRRSLVSAGNPDRLAAVFHRARLGQPIVVAVIGGSITQGASASKPENNYASLLAKWWRETFPKSEVTLVNAGIGATGSNYGALRAARDLLEKKPDFVVVEYGVNDAGDQASLDTYEGLLRQILKQPQQPAVLLMFTMHRNGTNAQEGQAKLGRHYQLPMVSFRDALWPEIEANRLRWEDVEADVVHPNDRGHAYMARFITHHLELSANQVADKGKGANAQSLPKPLFTDLFETVTLQEGRDLKPVRNHGWTLTEENIWKTGWKSSTEGSEIVFEISGTTIFFMDYRIRGPMGQALVQIDDRPAIRIDSWFDQTWGGYKRMQELVRGLPEGSHRIRVILAPDKNPESAGHEFIINAIGAAGR